MRTPSGNFAGTARVVTFGAFVLLVVVVLAGPALAHVELSASSPMDGATVTEAVSEITLDFSIPADIVGDGLAVFNQDAVSVALSVERVTETRIRLIPEQPLREGRWAVTWTMQAPDAHPRSGGFEFSVSMAEPGSELAESGAEVSGSSEHGADMAAGMQMDTAPSLLERVAPSQVGIGPWLGGLGRLLSILGAMVGIGALAFALLVFEGSESEARLIGFWARRAGAAVVTGVLVEVLGQAVVLANGSLIGALAPSTLFGASDGAFGVAVGFRLLGGIALLAGTRLETVAHESHRYTLPPDGGSRTMSVSATATVARQRFHVAASPGAMAGAIGIAVAFLFDGHTVTAQPSVLVRFASFVHVVAASIWVGGVALLARILVGRHRTGLPPDAARLVVPFSTVAGAAVAMVGLAGSVLALSIADGLGTFVSTPWGRALLAKIALAGAAGAIGAYNHIVLVPVLKSSNDHGSASVSIRTTARVEAALLMCIVVVTAIFVGLSSV